MDRHRKEQAGPVWAIRVMPPRMPINPGQNPKRKRMMMRMARPAVLRSA
jgi:hypothetical protein